MKPNHMHTFNSAVESLDRRTDFRFDTAGKFELLGVALMRFGWADKDVMALRDGLRQQFQEIVDATPRKP